MTRYPIYDYKRQRWTWIIPDVDTKHPDGTQENCEGVRYETRIIDGQLKYRNA